MALALLSAAATLASAAASPSCLIVRDAASAQDVKIEAHGDNAVRVRAVASGGAFKDSPDVITALTMINSFSDADCESAALTAAGQSVTSGNLKASVGSDGKLTFTRVSDSKVLLAEKSVRAMQPTTTTPSVPGFSSLLMAFEPVEGERIYGLGQHAAFPWDKDFPQNGQLDQKGVPAMLLEPHDGDVTIPIAHSSLGYVRLPSSSFPAASFSGCADWPDWAALVGQAFLSNLPSTGSVVYNSTGGFWSHDAVLQMDVK